MFLRYVLIVILFFFFSNDLCQAGRLNIFLNVIHPASQNVTISLQRIELKGTNRIYNLRDIPSKVSSKSTFGQVYLGYIELNREVFSSIDLYFRQVDVDGQVVSISKKKLSLPLSVSIRDNVSLSIFLIWDVKASLKGKVFQPTFYVRLQKRPLRGENLYVTCDDASTLFVVRADNNQVQASLYIPSQPKWLSVDNNNDMLYVLSDKTRTFSLVELSSFRIVDNFILPLVRSPTFFVLLPSKMALITDPDSSYVLLYNIFSGNLVLSKRLGYSPSEVFFSSLLNRIFVSSPSDQNIYVLTPNLDLVSTIKAGQRPRGLWVGRNRLYVADYGTGMVDVFGVGAFEPLGRIRSGAGAVQVFGQGSRIYVSNEKEGTISVLSLNQLSVARKIRVGKGPFTMASCPRRGWLYIALRGEKAVAVVDTASEELIGKIFLGCRPFGLVVGK